MKSNVNFDNFMLSDKKYTVYKENITIGKTNYKLLLQREITGPDKIEDVLCVNCFQFIPLDTKDAKNYILTMGYDGENDIYSFTFDISPVYSLINLCYIIATKESYPNIKNRLKEYYEDGLKMYCLEPNELPTSEEIIETLYALFDYCYEYLMVNGFHVSEIENKSKEAA